MAFPSISAGTLVGFGLADQFDLADYFVALPEDASDSPHDSPKSTDWRCSRHALHHACSRGAHWYDFTSAPGSPTTYAKDPRRRTQRRQQHSAERLFVEGMSCEDDRAVLGDEEVLFEADGLLEPGVSGEGFGCEVHVFLEFDRVVE